MRIGVLAKGSGIRAETVRYYEKVGLLDPPDRLANGYRDYGDRHVERLGFIRHCRDLGMSLDDIRQLLAFVAHPNAACAGVNDLIDAQLARVRDRITDLHTLERQLEALRARCHAGSAAGECGILQELVAAANDGDCVCHAIDGDQADESEKQGR